MVDVTTHMVSVERVVYAIPSGNACLLALGRGM